MATIRTILEDKDPIVQTVDKASSIRDAVEKMVKHRVGSLLVEGRGEPIGILTERDILTRLVLERRDPASTTVDEIMTHEVLCVPPDCEPEEAMALMTRCRVRHLPVVERGAIVGVVSIGDLVRWASRARDYELRTLHEYVSGVYIRA